MDETVLSEGPVEFSAGIRLGAFDESELEERLTEKKDRTQEEAENSEGLLSQEDEESSKRNEEKVEVAKGGENGVAVTNVEGRADLDGV